MIRRTRRNVWKRKVYIKNGTEGPSYDPYAYTETTVEINSSKITIHEGLGVWIEINGTKYPLREELCYKLFRALTGFESALEAYRAMEQVKKHSMNKCCKRHAEWVNGMPGESLLLCKKCGNYIDSRFDESAII